MALKIYKHYFAPDDAWSDEPMWFRLPYKRFLTHKAVKIKLFGIFTIYDWDKEERTMTKCEKIIKAMECCNSSPIDCKSCGYKDENEPRKPCFDILMVDALELIKELRDKYERTLYGLKAVLEERKEEQNNDGE